MTEMPPQLPSPGAEYVEFGADRLLGFPPFRPVWAGTQQPHALAATPLHGGSRGQAGGASGGATAEGTRVVVWTLMSEAGPAASSSRSSPSTALASVSAGSGVGRSHEWLELGRGTTAAAPCSAVECEACTASPGCGWCAERHQCMQGGEEAPCNEDECPRSLWMAHSCTASGAACGTFSSCGECTLNDDCGWCASALRCVAIEERTHSCPGRDAQFVGSANLCDGGLNAN